MLNYYTNSNLIPDNIMAVTETKRSTRYKTLVLDKPFNVKIIYSKGLGNISFAFFVNCQIRLLKPNYSQEKKKKNQKKKELI
jgi:hypothetical protein